MGSVPSIVFSAQNLKKKINDRWIIKGVSFDIREGEIFGFLGPNGSGKTTTIRMMVDLIRPTEGSITVCGKDIRKDHDEALRYVGSIVENPEMYSYLTGWENLEQFARMMPGVTEQRIHEVVEIVGMEQRIHDRVKTYSLGMRQRLGIAQALLGKPKLLILDEPTNGLDPQGIKELREFIRRLANDGMSLFISSHLLSEIQMMCDRVAIISHGEVLAVDEVNALLQQAGGKVIWHIDQREKAVEVLSAFQGVEVDDNPELETVPVIPEAQTIVTQLDVERISAINRHMVESGVEVFSIEVKNPTLEDLFLSMTEGERIG